MRIQIVKCHDKSLWYRGRNFPLKYEVEKDNFRYIITSEGKDKGSYVYPIDCIDDTDYEDVEVEKAKLLEFFDNSNQIKECSIETTKFDEGKPDFTAIPQEALLEVAKSFTHGASKYGSDNYSLGTKYRRYIAASQRHVNQWLRGEDIDESGTNHLSNAIASLMMVLDNQLTNKGVDDRNKVYQNQIKNGK